MVLVQEAMVRLTLAFTAPSARVAQDLLDGLRFLERVVRLQRGCVQCCSWTDPERRVHHLEDWATEADIRRRVGTKDFTLLLEMAETARDAWVQFDFITMTRGLDYVAEVRGAFGTRTHGAGSLEDSES